MKRGSSMLSVLIGIVLLSGCGDSPERDARKATDRLIRQANSAQEREALEKARDEAIAEMRRQIDAIDEEIRQLREKNAALEKELAE